jgi:hypothetical protein
MWRLVFILLMLLMILPSGCDKSSEPPEEVSFPDSADLLGLRRNHTLEYIIYDSLVTYFPDYAVSVDTTELVLDIAPGEKNQVELSVNGAPRDVLTIDALGILHTARIDPQAIPPDTQFFTPTPVIMPRHYTSGSTWSVVSPQYDSKASILYLYDGYFTQRKFMEKTDVILPTSSYEAFHFRSHLFVDEASPDTLVTVDEYYAADVGLIRLLSRAGGSRRLIILLDDN